MWSSLVFLLALSSSVAAQISTKDASECSCGFRDPDTDQLFTESLIVYFNETAHIDNQTFNVEDYIHKKEFGWKVIYRQAASPYNLVNGNDASLSWQNVTDGTDPSLQLFVDPPTTDHLVTGGAVRSLRQDIQYGSFRASMRSAHPWSSYGGSAMSMMLAFNSSENLHLDFMNMNEAPDARVGTLVNGEEPYDAIVTNYTTLAKGDSNNPPLQPWDFMTVRMDWNKTNVNFWVGENRTRAITKHDRSLPKVPMPLYLKHWSTGDTTYMEGPPNERSVANVRWVRAFFNSSLMTESQHKDFDSRCNITSSCLMDDESIRGSTAYTAEATKKWKEPGIGKTIHIVAAIVAAACSSFGVFSLLNVFIRNTPWHKLDPLGRAKRKSAQALRNSLRQSFQQQQQQQHPKPDTSETSTLNDLSKPQGGRISSEKKGFTSSKVRVMKSDTTLNPSGSSSSKITSTNASVLDWSGSTAAPTPATTAPPSPNAKPFYMRDIDEKEMEIKALEPIYEKSPEVDARKVAEAKLNGTEYFETSDVKTELDWKKTQVTVSSIPETPQPQPENSSVSKTTTSTAVITKPATPPRIDYLAGLVAIACIGVTLRHFALTFWPYVAAANGPTAHYPKAEKWFAIFLGDYLLTPLWIGPFFLTSCRFLSGNFFRTGDLDNVAQKIAIRAVRLLTPVVIIVTLEYFLISLGLTSSLEYLPSVSWATWPYVTTFPNFGSYLSDLIQLGYMIPNGAPEIILHYCVGVLWTMPVQLQCSYVVLLGAVMVRNIKTPWKRFGFYLFCSSMAWYARSWNACHWIGLMLADLEVTYKWVKYVQARWYIHYPLLSSMTALAAATPLVMVWSKNFNWQSAENSIHPDLATGKPIVQVDGSIYPDYFIPTFAHLTFAASLQIIVEMSTWVQAFLSIKVVLWIHPHIMTVYLTHGFIFWSWGAWVCVTLHAAGVPYWANLAITAITSYTIIAIAAKVLTPLVEFTTRAAIRNLWRWASQEPIPKRPTTAPFNKALVLDRSSNAAFKPE